MLKVMERGQLAEITGLLASALPDVRISSPIVLEKTFDAEDFRRSLCVGAFAGRNLVGVGSAVAYPGSSRLRGGIRVLAVSPHARRQGHGTSIVRYLEEELRRIGASGTVLMATPGNYLMPGIPVDWECGMAFAESAGYQLSGITENHTIELSPESMQRARAVADRRRDCRYTVRRVEHGEESELTRLVEREAPLCMREVSIALSASPAGIFIASDNASIVGFCAVEANNVGWGTIGPALVTATVRGRGLFERLFVASLMDLQSRGFARADACWINRRLGPLLMRLFQSRRVTFKRYVKN
jgi:GNAT superfamily N-acetyltransferase